ncbi:pimeloyl-ACP methyl ester carboxylesterase [Streptomyces sp. 1114.5]|uniref:alpha/beta fold hydrolase n=1 Tax=Streptomyces sp. 1114.5 TaxID=1938830 RepID=UPI000EB25A0D|nr:alpha/beta fold hydrolase [Streptomyces sp. 1114.5]RKT11765.1 pimeloyl-ACP methyl ester carboxylesterase [Streptomyces sp. 1114.5]
MPSTSTPLARSATSARPAPLAQPAPLARIVQGSGPGLLLAHGAGGSARDNWGPLLPELAAHRTVVAPDYPGSGNSPYEPGERTLDELADRLVATADEEGLETFDLAGYSLGAAVAVRIATRHPGRVRSLLLLAGVAGGSARTRMLSDLIVDLEERPDDLVRLMLTVVFGGTWVDALPADQLAGLREALTSPLPSGFPQQFRLAGTVDVRAELAAIAVPTLVVSTTEDMLVPPSQHRLLAEGIPGARLVELPSGHLPMVEVLPQLRDVVLEFVNGSDRG